MPPDRSPSPRTPPAGRSFVRGSASPRALGASLALLLGLALAGCAAPGEPTARHPVIPQSVRDLAARQQGNAFALSFTLPIRSTRPEPLAEPPTVEIYRGDLEPGAASARKPKMQLIYTIPSDIADSYEQDGRIVFRDPLGPDEMGRAPGAALIYLVRTRETGNRASAESNLVTVRIYPPPAPVGEVRATLAERAVMLTWTPAGEPSGAAAPAGAAGYRVYRAEIAPASAAAAEEDAAKAILLAPLALIGPTVDAAYRDAQVELGHTYLYIVRRAAQVGGDTVESADSKEAVVTVADVIPLAAPQDVQEVVMPATPQAGVYVALSWAISTETNVAGYAVHRSEQPDVPGPRLNDELLPTPTFRDLSVTPGRRYFYRVAAVDRAGSEGALSAAVEADVP